MWKSFILLATSIGLVGGCGGDDASFGHPMRQGIWLLSSSDTAPDFVTIHYRYTESKVSKGFTSFDAGASYCLQVVTQVPAEDAPRENGDILIRITWLEDGCGWKAGDENLVLTRPENPDTGAPDEDIVRFRTFSEGLTFDDPTVPNSAYYFCTGDVSRRADVCDEGMGGPWAQRGLATYPAVPDPA